MPESTHQLCGKPSLRRRPHTLTTLVTATAELCSETIGSDSSRQPTARTPAHASAAVARKQFELWIMRTLPRPSTRERAAKAVRKDPAKCEPGCGMTRHGPTRRDSLRCRGAAGLPGVRPGGA